MNIIFGVSRPLHMQPHIRLSEKLGKSHVASQEFVSVAPHNTSCEHFEHNLSDKSIRSLKVSLNST